jgi:Na+/melibiose symporter-like transporter
MPNWAEFVQSVQQHTSAAHIVALMFLVVPVVIGLMTNWIARTFQGFEDHKEDHSQ